jgi:hypothetical protein
MEDIEELADQGRRGLLGKIGRGCDPPQRVAMASYGDAAIKQLRIMREGGASNAELEKAARLYERNLGLDWRKALEASKTLT